MATTTINLGLSLSGLNDVFIHKETTPSATVTGTLTETQVYALTIPANSFSAGDKFVLDGIIVEKTGTAGLAAIRIKLSTSPTMPSGITDRIGNPQIIATNTSAIFGRKYNIYSGNIVGRAFNVAGGTSEFSDNNPLGNSLFDPTVTNYLYFSIVLNDVTDAVTIYGYTLINF